MSLLSCLNSIWLPCLRLIGFLRGNNTTPSHYSLSRFSLYIFSLITLPVITGVTIRLYIWPQIIHCVICLFYIFKHYLVSTYSDHPKPFFYRIFHQWSCHGVKYGARSIYILVEHHGGWYILHPGR